MDKFKIGDLIIDRAILKKNQTHIIWRIKGENIFKDGSHRWELEDKHSLNVACYRKDFIDEIYIKYDPAIEIIYGR